MSPQPPLGQEPVEVGDEGPFAPEPVEIGNEGPFAPGDVIQRNFRGHIGLLITGVVLLSLLGTVALAAGLALSNRDADYIDATLKSLAPFILPTLGAVVGYAFGEQSRANVA